MVTLIILIGYMAVECIVFSPTVACRTITSSDFTHLTMGGFLETVLEGYGYMIYRKIKKDKDE
jgi:hypothetical protein